MFFFHFDMDLEPEGKKIARRFWSFSTFSLVRLSWPKKWVISRKWEKMNIATEHYEWISHLKENKSMQFSFYNPKKVIFTLELKNRIYFLRTVDYNQRVVYYIFHLIIFYVSVVNYSLLMLIKIPSKKNFTKRAQNLRAYIC